MKKIISLLLVLAMCAALFAGCTPAGNDATTTAPTGNDTAALDSAKSYVYNMYKEDDGGSTVRNYSVVSVVSIGDASYDIVWTIEVSSGDASCLELTDDGTMATVNILNAKPTEEVVYSLVGTIADDAGNSVTVTFKHNIPAAEATGITFVDAPVAGTAYKFALEQNELGQTLFFTGEMSGYYLAMSENPFDGVDVYVEEVEGGAQLYFMSGDTKTYIDIVPRGEDQPGKVNVVLVTEPTAVYTWDSERKTYTTTVDGNPWYLGTYSTYNTISASNTSYIEDVSKIGDSQFPAGFCTVNIEATQVAEPVVGTGYKFALVQNSLGQTLYFTGEMSGYYLAMSENPAEGVEVYMEEAEGGYYLTYTIGGTKTYIDIVPRGEDQPGKVNVVLVAEPSAVYTWDAERKTFVTTVDGNPWYLGTYSTYNTISASNTSYIEDVSKIGDSQFPAGMYTVDGFEYVDKETEVEDETTDDKTDDTTTGSNETVSVEDGAQIKLYNAANGVYVTGESYLYNDFKYELVVSDSADSALVLTVKVEGDYVSFVTADGKYLMADGTNVQLVDESGDNTQFVLEAADGGYYIKCAHATYNDKAQYLEIYSGYLTCYGFNESNTGIYTFALNAA